MCVSVYACCVCICFMYVCMCTCIRIVCIMYGTNAHRRQYYYSAHVIKIIVQIYCTTHYVRIKLYYWLPYSSIGIVLSRVGQNLLDLDKALIMSFVSCMGETHTRGKIVHPMSFKSQMYCITHYVQVKLYHWLPCSSIAKVSS